MLDDLGANFPSIKESITNIYIDKLLKHHFCLAFWRLPLDEDILKATAISMVKLNVLFRISGRQE